MDTNVALTDEQAAALGGVLLGVGAIVLVVALIWYIINVIAMWRLFKKTGEPGWKSLVPVYNGIVLYGKAWEVKWFWITFLFTFLTYFANSLAQQDIAATVMSVIALATGVVGAVLLFLFNQRLAAAFGKSKGFGVGLWLLNPIFMLILAFGSSTYIGKAPNTPAQ